MTAVDDDLEGGLRRLAGRLDHLSNARIGTSPATAYLAPRSLRKMPRLVVAAAVIVVALTGGFVLAQREREQTPVGGPDVGGHILLAGPDVTIERYDEQPEDGTIHAETTFVVDGARFDLHQRGRGYNDDYLAGDTNVTVLGEAGLVLENGGDFRAFWRHGRRDLEFRGPAADEPTFRSLLGRLAYVDDAQWEAALPDTTVSPSERSAFVDDALADVPLPPGFDVGPLKATTRTSDRYQATAQTLAPVLCAWFDVWREAGDRVDTAARDQALAILAGSKDWTALKAMATEGDYPLAVAQIVGSLRTGSPVEGNPKGDPADGFESAIGC
ncbi:MAG: hypothetical protein AB7L13_17595 [Acidimicrobiia bacterium]